MSAHSRLNIKFKLTPKLIQLYHCIIDLLMHGVFAGRTQIDMKGQMGNWDAEFKVQTHYMVIIKSCYVEA